MTQPPNLLQGPEPVETADLHFKLICKLKIFESEAKYEDGNCNLLAISQHYGLVFVGNLNGFSVIKTKGINGATSYDEYPKRDVVLKLKPSHISVDFSQKLLAVVCLSRPGSMLILYNIASFLAKEVTILKVTPLTKFVQNAAAEVVELAWQPNTESGLMVCMSDGSVLALNPGGDGALFTLPSTTQATCFCWSPKGKQIVIGSAIGTLSQYKPDLKLVKTLPAPPLFNGAAVVVNVLWISSYQFAVAYNDRNSPESFPVITIVNAVKKEPVNVINYDDITYSSTLFRHHQIYMTHQSQWNLIFVSSANSIEVAVLHSKDGLAWEQWLLGDASRAELPLNPDRQETFPLGWGFDFTSEEIIPWGEGTLPPMPRLFLLSDEGVLCVFNVVNAKGDAPQLCGPPNETADDSLFVAKLAAPLLAEAPKPAPVVNTSTVTPVPTFGITKPAFGSGFGAFSAQPQTTTPQVTISLLGGPVLGNVKDAPFIIQQQQQQQQQLVQAQKQPQPQQPVVIPTLPASSPNSIKFSTPPAQFGTPGGPVFSFGMSTANLFGAKVATAQAAIPKFVPPQGEIFKTPSAPAQDFFAPGKNLLQSTPVKQPEAVQVQATAKPVVGKKVEEAEPSGKPEEGKGKSPGGSPGPGTPELATVDDSVYWNALQDEIDHFNSELQQLSARVGSLDIQVGTEGDKQKMRKSIDGLYEFWKELKETTSSQSSEIHSVVMDLMESFAWLEDAKSRNLHRKNPNFIQLKKSEELDPLSARHMNDIGHLKYYIENQLKQLTTYLEKEWMDHQENYRMAVKSRMAVPPLEEVYKTMHFQLKILNKQRLLIEELKEKLAARKRRNKSHTSLITNSAPIPPNPQGTNRVSELSKLAENLLQLRIDREENNPKYENWELMKSQLKAVSDRSKKLSADKQAALRDLLSERDMVKIRPVKTTFESSSFLRSLPLKTSPEKTDKGKPVAKAEEPKEKPPVKVKSPAAPKPQIDLEVRPKPVKTSEEAETKKPDTPKSIFVFGGFATPEKPTVPLTVHSSPPNKPPEEKTPLASLSGIVSSIGKENEVVKPKQPSSFVFAFQKPEPAKDGFVFAKPEQKTEEVKTSQPYTYVVPKPSEPAFGKTEPPKPSFGFVTPTPGTTAPATAKPAPTKTTSPSVSVVPALATTTTCPFNFSFGAVTTASPTVLPKINLFSGKEQSSGFGTKTTTSNFFAMAASTPSTATSIFGTSSPVFGGGKTTFETSTTSLFGAPKTTPKAGKQPLFGQSPETIASAATEGSPPAVVTIKPTSGTEEVDVVTVEETPKKSETTLESTARNSPKATVAPTLVSESPKSVPEPAPTSPAISAAPPNVQIVSTPPTTAVSINVFAKPAVTTTEAPTTSIASQPAATVPTSTVFSFSTASMGFGQTATTTAVTTTASIFGTTPATTASVFGQVSSTTPTTNIFGGATRTTNIFGGSTPTKPIFGQASTPTTSAGSIFGVTTTFGQASTPTTNTFGQASTPTSSPSAFGQKPDAVAQTANIFGQLLSDNNRSGGVFGTTAGTPTTSANLFSTPKNIFGGASTTTASLFGTTSSSIFPQTTSVFGQPTTSPSIFGQSQTQTSSSFFGQNICSPFGGGTTVTSNQSSFDSGGFGNTKPVFGQSLFGQTTNNTSVFGGSPSSSIFGGSSTSPTSGGNVFQTPTTSSAFGSTSPGPFSSGQGSVAETGFRAANSFQKPLGGFGSPPVFGSTPGSTPAFGASPTFSSSASFGSLPTFGNRSFDSPQGGFNTSPGHSATFENLANQNTVGFGNLAQQSQNQGFGSVAGFGSASPPSFENKPAFGGNSFSSWRSS